MKLYHGTTKKIAEKILKEGIKPRGNRKGNWKHTVDSRTDAVYMTDIYGLYFAYSSSKDNDTLAVIEIDVEKVDQSKLIPDEDFLEQASRGQTGKGLASNHLNMKERTVYYRAIAELNKNLWPKSLEYLGTVSYQGVIPVEAITRIAYVDMEKQKHVVMTAADASIALMNHKFCKPKYESLIRWIFGEEVTLVEWMGWGEEYLKMVPEDAKKQTEEMLKNREGIEIYEHCKR